MHDLEKYLGNREFWLLVWQIDNIPTDQERFAQMSVAMDNSSPDNEESILLCDLLALTRDELTTLISQANRELSGDLFRKE